MISLLIALCMVLAIAPITAFAGVEDITGDTPSTVYKHTYHTKVKMTANVTLQDSEGNTVDTYQLSEESADYIVGNVSDDAIQAEIARLEGVINPQLPSGAVKSNHTTETTFDHFESSYILETDKEGNTTSTLDVHEYQIYEITDEWTVKQDDNVINNSNPIILIDPSQPTEPAEPPQSNPNTGDNSNLLLWVALLFVSGAGVLGTTVYSKKKRVR